MGVLPKVLADDQTVEILIGPTLAYFTCGGVRVFTCLLNQSFPPYRQVLPTETRATMERGMAEYFTTKAL